MNKKDIKANIIIGLTVGFMLLAIDIFSEGSKVFLFKLGADSPENMVFVKSFGALILATIIGWQLYKK